MVKCVNLSTSTDGKNAATSQRSRAGTPRPRGIPRLYLKPHKSNYSYNDKLLGDKLNPSIITIFKTRELPPNTPPTSARSKIPEPKYNKRSESENPSLERTVFTNPNTNKAASSESIENAGDHAGDAKLCVETLSPFQLISEQNKQSTETSDNKYQIVNYKSKPEPSNILTPRVNINNSIGVLHLVSPCSKTFIKDSNPSVLQTVKKDFNTPEIKTPVKDIIDYSSDSTPEDIQIYPDKLENEYINSVVCRVQPPHYTVCSYDEPRKCFKKEINKTELEEEEDWSGSSDTDSTYSYDSVSPRMISLLTLLSFAYGFYYISPYIAVLLKNIYYTILPPPEPTWSQLFIDAIEYVIDDICHTISMVFSLPYLCYYGWG